MAGMPGEQPPAKGLPGPEAAWQRGKARRPRITTRSEEQEAAGSSARGTSSTTRPADSSSRKEHHDERAREGAFLPVSVTKALHDGS